MPPTANGRTASSHESDYQETSRKARAAAASLGPSHVTVIEARRGWRLVDWRELVAYRDLFRFLVWREVRVRYAQSVIGIGWAVIQPVFSMLIFTVVFGRLAAVPSDGVPYALFSLAAMVPWTFFSNALTEGANSLVGNATILSKVYFPRILMPLSAVVAKLVDFGIALVILFGAMFVYGASPTMDALALPVVVLLMVVAAAGHQHVAGRAGPAVQGREARDELRRTGVDVLHARRVPDEPDSHGVRGGRRHGQPAAVVRLESHGRRHRGVSLRASRDVGVSVESGCDGLAVGSAGRRVGHALLPEPGTSVRRRRVACTCTRTRR